ncbi:MAG: DUF4829 domain-containing protein [Actinomycetota bacterium]|nr:DUF4829 domain-containing protein [Actinomycetota bacterium]
MRTGRFLLLPLWLVIAFGATCVFVGLFTFRGVILGIFLPMPDIDTLSARHLVKTYYQRLAIGDTAGANQCLSDDYRRALNDTLNAPNTIHSDPLWISDVNISKGAHIRMQGINSTNHDELQFVVQYNAWHIGSMSYLSGRELGFVYVAKETKKSPWRIISIGCGP